MIMFNLVTEHVASEPLLQVLVISLLVVKGDMLNVLSHENDEEIPFLVD
jgi:hypothetical protein